MSKPEIEASIPLGRWDDTTGTWDSSASIDLWRGEKGAILMEVHDDNERATQVHINYTALVELYDFIGKGLA